MESSPMTQTCSDERAHEIAMLAAEAASAAARNKDLDPPVAAAAVVEAYRTSLQQLTGPAA